MSAKPERSATDLTLNEQRLQAIYDSVNDGILIQDQESGAILDVNRRLCGWFGYAAEDLLKLDLGRLGLGLWPYTGETAREWSRKAAAGTPQTFEWLCTTQGGSLLWLEVNMRLADIGGQDRLVVTAGNITERKRVEMENAGRLKRAEAQNAVSLALAGVGPDVAAALRLIVHHLAVQVGDLCTLNLVGDVDFFKRFNDLNGHVAGDGCLQVIGEVMRDVFRRVDELPARYGGEEFAVVLPGADPDTARQAAEKLRQAVAARRIPHGASAVAPYVTLSLGFVSARVTSGTTPDWFISWADEG